MDKIKKYITKISSQNRNKYILLVTVFLILFGLIFIYIKRLIGSDDTVFPILIEPYHSVGSWVTHRYNTWSGRIFSEAFTYTFNVLPMYFWRLTSLIMYILMALVTFGYYLLIAKHTTHKKNVAMLVLAFILPFILDNSVLFTSTFWMTGSMNYSWIVTFGLIAFYPVLYYLIKSTPPKVYISLIGLVSAIIASSSQEQVGLVLIAMTLMSVAYTYIKNRKENIRKHPIYIIMFNIIYIIGFYISVRAPGNTARLHSETLHWLPDFYDINKLTHAEYAARWVFDSLFNHLGFILILAWIITALLIFAKQKKTKVDYIISFILLFASVFSLAKGYENVSYWFQFYATWKPTITSKLFYINLLPWALVIMSTVISPFFVFGKKPKSMFIAMMYLAALASTALITLSPTVYASGLRTLFVPSVIIMLIAYILIEELYEKRKKAFSVLFIVILGLSLSEYALTLFNTIKTP